MSAVPDEVPMPPVKSGCFRCGVQTWDIQRRPGSLVISPRGKAHYGSSYGETACGIDATGPKWWWPL